MKASWLAQRERGSALAIRLIVWITRGLGRSAGRVLLTPICLYFLAFSSSARNASRRYLGRVLGRRARFADVYRHYHTFAATIHDRIYMLSGRYDYFEVHSDGESALDAELARGRGCILLGSHLGSFEVLRARGTFERRAPINVLMYEDNATKINNVLHRLNPGIQSRIIALGTPMTLLRAKECLDRGEMVGILGDRAVRNDRSQLCDFLGMPAPLPEGPLLLAAILGTPVFLFFGIYRGGNRYDIHFELLAREINLRRAHRSEDLTHWLRRYAERLEHHCRRAPYNWFNFFDFWREHEQLSNTAPEHRAR